MRRNEFVKTRTMAGVALLIAASLLVGCQQSQSKQEPTNEKKARLLATQSADLQKQVAARDAEIAALRQKNAQDIKQRDDELAQCKARIKTLEEEVKTGIAERVSGVTASVMNDNAKLREEITRLKAEIEALKKAAGSQP